MDAITQQRLAELHPVLARRLTDTINDCAAAGIYLRVTMGLRSPNMQHALWLQGRQPLDVVNEARSAVGLAAITDEENREEVTHADWTQSMHCFGLAGDVAPSEGSVMEPFDPDWNVRDPQWAKVLEIASTHGLAEGAQWTSTKRDYPHLYPVELDANPTPEMQQNFKDAGLKGVWENLNLP